MIVGCDGGNTIGCWYSSWLWLRLCVENNEKGGRANDVCLLGRTRWRNFNEIISNIFLAAAVSLDGPSSSYPSHLRRRSCVTEPMRSHREEGEDTKGRRLRLLTELGKEREREKKPFGAFLASLAPRSSITVEHGAALDLWQGVFFFSLSLFSWLLAERKSRIASLYAPANAPFPALALFFLEQAWKR